MFDWKPGPYTLLLKQTQATSASLWNSEITEVKLRWSRFQALQLGLFTEWTHTMSPGKEGCADPKEAMQPPNQKGSQWGDKRTHLSSPRRNHCVLESMCSWRWPWDTGETANSYVYNLFDKGGKHAVPCVKGPSRLWLEKKAGQGVSMGSGAGIRTGFSLDIWVHGTSQWQESAIQGQRFRVPTLLYINYILMKLAEKRMQTLLLECDLLE